MGSTLSIQRLKYESQIGFELFLSAVTWVNLKVEPLPQSDAHLEVLSDVRFVPHFARNIGKQANNFFAHIISPLASF